MVRLKVGSNESGNAVVLADGIFGLRTMTLNIKKDEFIERWNKRNQNNQKISEAFPELNQDEKDFLASGTTRGDWE